MGLDFLSSFRHIVAVVMMAGQFMASSQFSLPPDSPSPVLSSQMQAEPTPQPTTVPTPTLKPTPLPTQKPTPLPTRIPTAAPTLRPTSVPVPTPTSAPRVQAPAVGHMQVIEYIAQYSGEYGVDKMLLERIARCESGLNSNALSRNGLYGGIFQFSASTWQSTRNRMGLDNNPDLRFNAQEAVRTAAYKMSKDGTSAWAGCL